MIMQKCLISLGIITCFITSVLAQKAVLCYIAAWSVGRPNEGKFSVLDADTDHCTHIVYAFMALDPDTNKIKSVDKYIDLDAQGLGQNQLIKLKQLKISNPDVKLLVSIGGWNEAGKKFSDMARSPEKRATFIASVVEFLRKYQLDGLDFCWQFPGQRGGRPEDKNNVVTLFQEIKEAFERDGWLLTVHIIGKRYVMDSYNIRAVSNIVDFINLLAVEYSGPWERKTGIMAPLTSRNDLNVKFSVDYMIKNGASPSKLLLGLPTYGHAYVLPAPPNNNYIGLFSNETFSSQWTNEYGITGYHETCYNMKQNDGWKLIWDAASQTPLGSNDRKFISFDNERSLVLKADLVDSRLLGGVAIWSLDMDDFRGLCHGVKYPLVTAVSNHINKIAVTTTEPTLLSINKQNQQNSPGTSTGFQSTDDQPPPLPQSPENQSPSLSQSPENQSPSLSPASENQSPENPVPSQPQSLENQFPSLSQSPEKFQPPSLSQSQGVQPPSLSQSQGVQPPPLYQSSEIQIPLGPQSPESQVPTLPQFSDRQPPFPQTTDTQIPQLPPLPQSSNAPIPPLPQLPDNRPILYTPNSGSHMRPYPGYPTEINTSVGPFEGKMYKLLIKIYLFSSK